MQLDKLQRYLDRLFGSPTSIEAMEGLASGRQDEGALKGFGYGDPLLIQCRVNSTEKRIVLHRIRPNSFGRERTADRVAAVWLDYDTFNTLPRHIKALDRFAWLENDELISLKDARALMLITEYQPGSPYADDLTRILEHGELTQNDLDRAAVLGTYLAEIHALKKQDRSLWRRRLRDLVGHGEGIMGLTDSYPDQTSFTTVEELREIEMQANRWRWRLRDHSHRLSWVHGDFHPFNIIFAKGKNFYLLDRSRGAWGAPEDDVGSMALNYVFFSVQASDDFTSPFKDLHDRFWDAYFAKRSDDELLTCIQPWFAWRALVLASPLWYPNIPDRTRRTLLDFTHNVLAADRYDHTDVKAYLK